MIDDPTILAEHAERTRRRDLMMLNPPDWATPAAISRPPTSSRRSIWPSCASIRRARLARPGPLHPEQGPCVGDAVQRPGRGRLLPAEELATFAQPESRLNGHPSNSKLPGVETSTGPLGHGLPVAVGAALGAKMDDAQWRTFVLTGDGELQEGSNWEAAMAAAHFGLDNLTWIVDRNGLQQGDATERTIRLEPLADKMRAFGWAVREVDGHDHAALIETFRSLPFEPGEPNGIIAHTHKGKGVSFIQDRAEWHHHHRALSNDEMAAALAELGRCDQEQLSDCRDAFAAALEALARADRRIVAICNDSVSSSKLGRFAKEFPDRLINVGIAEQNMIGVAAGLANAGKLPFVCGASCFLTGRAGADQGRSGLLARKRQAVRHEQRRRVR